MALDTPVEPFGATGKGAADLVPEARLIPGDTVPAGKYGVTEAQVEAWVRELTGAVALRLAGWQGLSATPVAPETTSDRDQLIAYARTIVHNGAASYLEAARFPERASNADTSYAAVLWARYRDGLADLAGWLEARLDEGTVTEPTPPDAGSDGPIGSFPAVLFGDGLRF